MALYHLAWDLAWFGFVDWPVNKGLQWRAFAASIAGSFLFLAGISLVVAHIDGIRWRNVAKRTAKIGLAAAAVSFGTWLAFGPAFVRFGILHSIAVSSLIALPFVRLPAFCALIAGAGFASAPFWARSPVFDGPWLMWTGLGEAGVASVDYVPLAPWAGTTLFGVWFGLIYARSGALDQLRERPAETGVARALAFFGRHSLLVYLVHQPVLFGLVWGLALAMGRASF